MRLHVVSICTTQTTQEYIHCAYTQKVRKFCNMMMSLGDEVFLYASEQNEAACTELIPCITREQQREFLGMEKATDNLKQSGSNWSEGIRLFNKNAINGIRDRLEPGDLICLIGGSGHQSIAEAFPDIKSIEFGIGYRIFFAKYKVFESYAWMHFCYGLRNIRHDQQGKIFDTVIPNYFEPSEFPYSKEKDDYYLFIGRLIDSKGYQIAIETCKKMNKRLVIAGQGQPPDYGEYVGVVGVKERGELMSKAQAVFVPSLYVEPFGGVHVEAMLCGTPVITTDWGAFPENNMQGKTGYRCRSQKDFIDALENVKQLDSEEIHEYALSRYSTEVVKYQYRNYFQSIIDTEKDNWHTLEKS